MESPNSISTSLGSNPVCLVLVDDVPFGYVSVALSSETFSKFVEDKRIQLTQDLGQNPTVSSTTDIDTGHSIIIFESPTRSYIWNGPRVRCKLEMVTLRNLTILGKNNL